MRKHSEEFKQSVLQSIQDGLTISTAAKNAGLSPSLIRYWMRADRHTKRAKPVTMVKPAPKPQPSTPEETLNATEREAVAFVTGQCHAWITIAAERYGVSSRTLTQRVGALLQRT